MNNLQTVPQTQKVVATYQNQFDSESTLINAWLLSVSPKTRKIYKYAVTDFMELVRKPLAQITVQDISEYLASISDQRNQNSAHTMYSCVKSLFSFAMKTGYLRYNPTSARKNVKTQLPLTERILSPAEVQKLFTTCRSDRDRAMLACMYYGGLRISEVVSLRQDGVKRLEDGRLKLSVIGKGSKKRDVVLNAKASELVSLHVSNVGSHEYVFVSTADDSMTPHLSTFAAHHTIKRLAKRAGLGNKVSAHWLRHSHATHALTNGARLDLVSKTLGHSSIAITGVYLHSLATETSSDSLL